MPVCGSVTVGCADGLRVGGNEFDDVLLPVWGREAVGRSEAVTDGESVEAKLGELVGIPDWVIVFDAPVVAVGKIEAEVEAALDAVCVGVIGGVSVGNLVTVGVVGRVPDCDKDPVDGRDDVCVSVGR